MPRKIDSDTFELDTEAGEPVGGITDEGNAKFKFFRIDPTTKGVLVTGTGVAPAATAIKIADGNDTDEATVSGGKVSVRAVDLETKLDTLNAALDTVEAKLQSLLDNTDGLEGFVDGIETLLTTIRDNADTVETLLTNIGSNTDGLEGFVDGIEGLLTSIRDNADEVEARLRDIKRSVTDFRTILDYDTRTDGNPVYVGKNLQTELVATATWVIQKLFYDSSDRLVDAQVLIGAWSGRADLTWKSSGGD